MADQDGAGSPHRAGPCGSAERIGPARPFVQRGAEQVGGSMPVISSARGSILAPGKQHHVGRDHGHGATTPCSSMPMGTAAISSRASRSASTTGLDVDHHRQKAAEASAMRPARGEGSSIMRGKDTGSFSRRPNRAATLAVDRGSAAQPARGECQGSPASQRGAQGGSSIRKAVPARPAAGPRRGVVDRVRGIPRCAAGALRGDPG